MHLKGKGIAGFALICAVAGTLLWPPGIAESNWHKQAPPFSGDLRDVSLLEHPRPAPDYRFKGPAGQDLSLADFRGKVVFLNFWATWCPPCIEEMPSLDRLQAKLGGERFEVLALSLDRSREIIEAFYQDTDLDQLAIYRDEGGKAMEVFRAGVLPTTLIIGPDGLLLGGLAGPADWASEEALTFARYFIEQGNKWRRQNHR